MQFNTGSYIGTGIPHSITWTTGPLFTPDVVIVKGDDSQYAVFRTSAMPAFQTAAFASLASLFSNAITAFLANTFQIGSHSTVNANGVNYYWAAFADNGAGDMAVGSYIGNSVDNRNLDIVGFQPTILWIKAGSGTGSLYYGIWKVPETPADECGPTATHFGIYSFGLCNSIQVLRPLGFQVGTSIGANRAGITYYYVAFLDIPDLIETGSYPGNGIDDRNINVGFEPDMVFAGSNELGHSVLRIDTMPTGQSGRFQPEALAPDRIQGFAANVFQVGTNADVNWPSAEPQRVYCWAAWQVGESAAPTTSTTSTTTLLTSSTTSTTSTSTLTTTITTTTLSCALEIAGTAPVLRIRDRDTIVNLLKRSKQSGYRLCGWTPRISDYKRGGIWQDSPIAEGRRLAQRRFGNVAETMNLTMSGHRLETLIRESQDIRRLMEKASDYWGTNWQNDPVWIEARAKCETNTRYAILHRGKILRDPNPYSQPFMERRYGRTAARNLNLVLERGHWQDLPPECSASVLASARECYEQPYHLEFDGVHSVLNCGSDAGLDDLPTGAFTAEAWIRADSLGETDNGVVIGKVNWILRWNAAQGLFGGVWYLPTVGRAYAGFDDLTPDGEWHHVAMTWDDATYNYPRLWIDGVEPSYVSTANRAGAYISDAVISLDIGATGSFGNWDGGIGWTRVSDIVRYSGSFTPLERCKLPIIDANTVGQWIGPEDEGTTIDNQEGTAARDGTANCEFGVDCERCYGNVDSVACYPHYLGFDGASSIVNCGSEAGLDDIPDGAQITVDGWVRSLSDGELNTGTILQKADNTTIANGWRLAVGVAGLAGRVNAVTDARSTSGTDEFDPTDATWHHVLMTYDATGASTPVARNVYLAIDGIWVASYSAQVTGAGAYASDAAESLMIGNVAAATRTFDGDIGWIRVSDNVRYTVNADFAPPARCSLPAIDANTLGQWIGEEPSGAIIINQEGTDTRNGTQTNCTFACDCSVATTGELHPVADHIYVANKRNEANITHVFRYDTSLAAYSANLVGTVPYNLLPVIPAVGDIVYFGIDSAGSDAGPFTSLVFDLENAHANITGIVWEFWWPDGAAWIPLYFGRDNTQDWNNVAFGQIGINSVAWEEFEWTVAVNGVTGYWVRARVTGIGAAPTPPRQQNRDVYTVTWPYLEIDGGQVGGDIVALAYFEMVSAAFEADEVTVGLRSLARGANFNAYLNFADEQHLPGVSVVASGNCAFADTAWTGTGRDVVYTAGANGKVEFQFGPSVCNQWYGVYHAYIRGVQQSGFAGDTTFTVSVELGSGAVVQEQVTGLEFAAPTIWHRVDIGRLEISPPSLLDTNEAYNINKIVIDVSGTEDVHFFDLILIPIDEWGARFVDLEQGDLSTNRLQPGRVLEFESVKHPKQQIRANLWARNSDRIVGHWDRQVNGPAILQANTSQRLWVLASLGDVSRPEILTWFSVEAVQRYLSMRGDR